MTSAQTLTEADRRVVAGWAADCAERVLAAFEAESPTDGRPRDAVARARAFARGELGAAARAAAQAAAVAHMGAHALGAAAYAAKAAALMAPDQPKALAAEIRWQLDHATVAVREALRRLPPLGEDSAGPLGPGLLATGVLASVIREIQANMTDPPED